MVDLMGLRRDGSEFPRFESAADPNEILISHATCALVKDAIACEPRGEIMVKGIAHPIQTYQVIDFREKLLASMDGLREQTDDFVPRGRFCSYTAR